MIRYRLKCPEDHGFDSWFKSSDAFESLRESALLSCPICGDKRITKAIMAPPVHAKSTKSAPDGPPSPAPSEVQGRNAAEGANEAPAAAPTQTLLTSPSDRVAAAMEHLKREIEANSDYVGADFAREARAMHDGDTPERAIHGEAEPEETRALLEDGVPVLPLPFLPRRKVN
ncbi:MAG: hypothetical protein ACJA06_002422 [Halocynthiibacter sp.]|jgi:hypothetical protein